MIRVNKILINPSQSNYAPTVDILKFYIEGVSKNFYEKFSVCNAKLNSNKNTSATDIDTRNQEFYLTTSINPMFDELAQTNLKDSVKQALLKTNSYLNNNELESYINFEIDLVTEHRNVFVLDKNTYEM